ncbi:MAG: hypothetical protein GU359_03475 [Desulfurococcales archaeon]|jgi:hypothetical protein|nr:hypothetical protein [Desulfurococcales archaeon]
MDEEIHKVFLKIAKMIGLYQIVVDRDVIKTDKAEDVLDEIPDEAEYVIKKSDKTYYFYLLNQPFYVWIRKTKAYDIERKKLIDIYVVKLSYEEFDIEIFVDENMNIMDVSIR